MLPLASTTSTRERLVSLDVFRGLTIAGMLLVNHPGSWASVYPPLLHAPWHGWTPTDLVFPFFLFIVGITTAISLGSRRARGDDAGAIRRQVLRRGFWIFFLGCVVLSGFPWFTWTDIPGNPDPSVLDRVVHRLESWRIMGVLQRIAVAYVIAALIAQRATLKRQVVIAVTLLFGYWFAMTLLPVPGTGMLGYHALATPGGTLAAWLDRLLLDWSEYGLGNHLWSGSRTWDPEGILSTAPAVVTAMLGIFAGQWIVSGRPLVERLNGLFAAGALGMVVGLMWNWSFPINKGIWTSSYVVFTAGMACVSLATIMWLVDLHRVDRWTRPFVIYGMNPIIAFVGSGIMARLIYSIIRVQYDGKEVSLQSAIYQSAFLSWLEPKNASLLFAVAVVTFWYLVVYGLYRKNIFLRV